jgi:alkaline phosphatase D
MYEMQNRPETFIIADDFLEGLNKQDFLFVNNSTHGNIFLKNKDKADEIFNAIAAKEKHFKIYKKADIPEKLHFNTNARIGDMLLVVEPGYGFYNKESLAKKPEKRKVWGVHGFDPTACPEMGAIFYANGPNIKKGVKIPTFQNIHVYPFIAQLLGISTLQSTEILKFYKG